MAAEHGQGMGGAAPLGFDREVERQVVNTALSSLFCVLVQPKRLRTLAVKEKYETITSEVFDTDLQRCLDTRDLDDAITSKTIERQATGFVVAARGTTLRILTCAHTIADIYTFGYHNKLSLSEVNSMFKFHVHCFHHEENVRTRPMDQPISDRIRVPTEAVVVALDTEKDLMVLEFGTGRLCAKDERDVGGAKTWCQAVHPVIDRAIAVPNKMQKVVLVGWPPQRSGSCVMGQVSFNHWTYDAITSLNLKGYNMRLLEVPGMAGDSGFSGAPVLNGAGQYTGVFHGVFNLFTGYAVCLEDVNNFLQEHHVFDWL